MDALNQTVKQAVFEYAGGGFNLKTFPVMSEDQQAFAVLIADVPVRKRDADILVFARVENDTVIIEADSTDYPLLDVLIDKGIPREKIVCAYAGETLPNLQTTS